ncbi:MAG: ABC transporter ATP-binding protein [Wujia sp.]
MIKIRDLEFEYFERDEEGNLTDMINAIRGIHFDAQKGEFIALAGVNGSGKSTFAKVLNRLLVPLEGTVEIDGMDARKEENTFPIRKTVGMVFQNPDHQLIGSIVEEDVAFGAENIGVPFPELEKRVQQAVETVGIDRYASLANLSGGEKQKVAIAGVLAMKPKYIVLDEATSMLDPKSRVEILQVMKNLQEQGFTIILITHMMEELLLADWVYIFHKGKLVKKGNRDLLYHQGDVLKEYGLESPVFVRIVNRLYEAKVLRTKQLYTVEELVARIRTEYPYAFLKEKKLPKPKQNPHTYLPTQAIVFQNVSFAYENKQVIDSVSFSIAKGEFVGIVGPSGAGKSTILQMIPGLLRPQDGVIFVDGYDLTDSATNLSMIRQKVGYVFQYPEQQLFANNVFEDVVFGPRNLGISEVEAEKRAYEAISLMGLSQDVYDMPTEQLSGGQRRRVAIAGVIAMQPEYLILDEPLAGLDPSGRNELLQILCALHKDAGITIVMVSHDLEAIAEYADTLIMVDNGTVQYQGSPAETFYEMWYHRRRDYEIPVSMQIMERLREQGMQLPCCISEEKACVQEIVKAIRNR